jgi:hypothetical protein
LIRGSSQMGGHLYLHMQYHRCIHACGANKIMGDSIKA